MARLRDTLRTSHPRHQSRWLCQPAIEIAGCLAAVTSLVPAFDRLPFGANPRLDMIAERVARRDPETLGGTATVGATQTTGEHGAVFVPPSPSRLRVMRNGRNIIRSARIPKPVVLVDTREKNPFRLHVNHPNWIGGERRVALKTAATLAVLRLAASDVQPHHAVEARV